jgi:hypothetical protein
VAKLIYAVTALALGALVSGFFVNSSSVPLIASIALSGVVMLLILFGWSRRIRRGIDLFDEDDEGVEMAELAEPDDDEAFKPSEPVTVRETVSVGGRQRGPKRGDVTTVVDVDEPDAPELTIVEPPAGLARDAKPAPKKPSAKKPAAKKPSAKRRAPAARKKAPAKKPAARKPAARKATAARKPSAARVPSERPGRVLVIPGRSRYHLPGCRFARGDQVREVSETTAQRRGYEACNVCGS